MRTAKKQRPAHSPELMVFCRQVRKRSLENRQALGVLHRNTLTGNVMAVVRQELDSMVRCIFLLFISDRRYRNRLIADAVNGRQWRTPDGKGKITDRAMVELSSKLHGWTRNVYAFGCGFIHLSAFHDYPNKDPFDSLTPEERNDITQYLRSYHGFAMDSATKFHDIVGFAEVAEATHIPSKSLMRMLGPTGNPRADNLFEIVSFLQNREGVRFHVKAALA